jgi:ABC-type Na+ efflux pump permease subunit
MSRRLSLIFFLALITMAAWSMAGSALELRQTTNVELVRFEGTALDNAVRLEWDTETRTPGGSLAGKIYLWAAFIAALVIFIAAVVGAILIYTRQRSKE